MTFERFVDKLRLWGRPWLAGTEPVELHRAILEEVDAQVVAVGGGRRVFPFDRVEVKLLAPTPEDAARLAAIAEAAWDLDREVAARLKAAGATVPPGLAVTLQVTEEDAPPLPAATTPSPSAAPVPPAKPRPPPSSTPATAPWPGRTTTSIRPKLPRCACP
jgi:hypothetical protein